MVCKYQHWHVGAEIGGAFGGVETGGGRTRVRLMETVHEKADKYNKLGSDLPLAQGIEFNIKD